MLIGSLLFLAPCFAAALGGASQLRGTAAAGGLREKPAASLLTRKQRKWSWRTASEESKTEWAIVTKRYVMVDTTLFELERHLDEGLEASTGGDREAAKESLGQAQARLDKMRSNLERAVTDQNTSDATSLDMQKQRSGDHLTADERLVLSDEQKREREGFFAVEASGQDVLQKATILLQAIMKEEEHTTSPRGKPSWRNIVNATPEVAPQPSLDRRPSLLAAPSAAELFQKYREAAKAFHEDLGDFEAMQQKAFVGPSGGAA